MRSESKTKRSDAVSVTGIVLALGLLAGCSQTGGSSTLGIQPTLAMNTDAAATGTAVSAADDAEVAELPAQTTAFPSAPAYAATSTTGSAPGEALQQVASLEPAAGGSLAASPAVTTDYAPALAGRAQAVAFSSRDHECLARAMFFESNRSSREGMVAVGSVVMNRVRDGRWGNSVCEVVGAPKQFAPGVLSRSMDSAGAPLAAEAARAVLKGERHPRIYDDVMFFHTAGYRFSYDNMHYVAVAGGNSFYEKRRRMRGRPNTPQSAIMTLASSPVRAASAVAQPVRKALRGPVEAAKKILPISEELEQEAAPAKRKRIPVADATQPDSSRFDSSF